MIDTLRFRCVDCRSWKAAVRDSQVIFGRTPQGLIGRCFDCGAGLPVIGVDEDYVFRWNETEWRISLGIDIPAQRYCYVVSQWHEGDPSAPDHWHPIKTFPLDELKQAILNVEKPAISDDELLNVHVAASKWPDRMFWDALLKR